jgi:tRNA 2-thiouridine synthesizing protein D
VKFAVVVAGSPTRSSTHGHAALFCRAVLAAGHSLERVFFHDDGTEIGLATAVWPQDESDPREIWRQIAAESGVELVLCVSSALRRGILDSAEADRYEKDGATLDGAFTIGGLGLLVEAAGNADRVVTFGG